MSGIHSEGFTRIGALAIANRNPRSSSYVSVPSGCSPDARTRFKSATLRNSDAGAPSIIPG
jgi:hypothetical protein